MFKRNIDSPPRIEYLRIKNYRVLRDLTLAPVTPLTVLIGPNGSGKSTVFDVFAFLAESFLVGLRKAWDKRGRFKELLTRGEKGNIEIELKYREKPNTPILTYHLSIGENLLGPFVAEEWLRWKRLPRGKPFRFLDFQNGSGEVVTGDFPDIESEREAVRSFEKLNSPDLLAVNTLGQFAKHPRVSALRRFITDWHLSYLSADSTRGVPDAGPQERLSPTGDNLPNVIQYLQEQHPTRLEKIFSTLSKRVPCLEKVDATLLQDNRLLLQIKDAPFEKPILSKYASDGTLKLLAYLAMLYDPQPPQLIGIEEPENYLHPSLLLELAEECRSASANTQLMVTTHSPFILNGLKAKEVWVLERNEKGYTQAFNPAQDASVMAHMEEGAKLGQLWIEKFFPVGYPLARK